MNIMLGLLVVLAWCYVVAAMWHAPDDPDEHDPHA